MTPPTPSAIRTAVTESLDISAEVLAAAGPDRPAAADLAKALLIRVLVDESPLSVREASLAAGFRSQHAGRVLLARLSLGEFEDSPAIPSKFEGSTAALITATKSVLEPSPL